MHACMHAPQPKRESLVDVVTDVLGVGVPCLVLCHTVLNSENVTVTVTDDVQRCPPIAPPAILLGSER